MYECNQIKADIRNPLSLLAHERSRFANCQWELSGQSTSQQKINHPKTLKSLEVVDFYFAAIMYEITTFQQDSLCHKTESIPCPF